MEIMQVVIHSTIIQLIDCGNFVYGVLCLKSPFLVSVRKSVYLFSTSTLSVSSATLFEAFNMAKITTVAIFCYGMKCQHHMEILDYLPPPSDATPAVRLEPTVPHTTSLSFL